MEKPDFNEMTRKELKAYVLENREDDEAIEILIRTFKSDGPSYPCPQTEEEFQEMQAMFLSKIKNRNAA